MQAQAPAWEWGWVAGTAGGGAVWSSPHGESRPSCLTGPAEQGPGPGTGALLLWELQGRSLGSERYHAALYSNSSTLQNRKRILLRFV